MNRFLRTDSADYGATLVSIFLGLVMFPHGAQKLFGWFGGYGFSGTMGFFTEQMGVPAILAFLVIIAESFGAIGAIAGVLTRLSGIGIAAVMAVAAVIRAPNGFFMNWDGSQAGEGYEYHLLMLGMAIAVIIRRGGAFSADTTLNRALNTR